MEILKSFIDQKECALSDRSKTIVAAFAANHPQVSTNAIELICAISRYILLDDINIELQTLNMQPFQWINFQNISASTVSSSSIENYVLEFAVKQLIIIQYNLRLNQNIFVQSDGGHKGQAVRLFSYFDSATEKIETAWMGLTYCGKSLLQVAAGIKQSLDLCIGDGRQMTGSTGDSGCGTPESFGVVPYLPPRSQVFC